MKKIIDYLIKNNRIPQSLIIEGKIEHGGLDIAFYIAEKFLKISNKNHPDLKIVEKDGKNIKISQIKEIQEFCYLSPHNAKGKIVILKNAETMSLEAANSFLKILEEPIENRYFILLVENKNHLLPTIISRCILFKLKPIVIDNNDFLINDFFNIANIKEKDKIEKFLNYFKLYFEKKDISNVFEDGMKLIKKYDLETFLKIFLLIIEKKIYNSKNINDENIKYFEFLLSVYKTVKFNLNAEFILTLIILNFLNKNFEVIKFE